MMKLTLEERSILLRDLGSRIPYKPLIKSIWGSKGSDGTIERKETTRVLELHDLVDFWNCRLYLRPLSSMTDEEATEFEELSDRLLKDGENLEIWNTVIDWLDRKMFDHRTLGGKTMIECGLALEAPDYIIKLYQNR